MKTIIKRHCEYCGTLQVFPMEHVPGMWEVKLCQHNLIPGNPPTQFVSRAYSVIDITPFKETGSTEYLKNLSGEHIDSSEDRESASLFLPRPNCPQIT